MAGSQGGGVMDHILGVNQTQDSFVTQSQLNSLLDAWYAKKQPLQRSEAAPNTNTYTPSYSSDATQQAAGTSTQQAPVSQPAPQQRQDYGWQPQLFMGAYGMQSPFRGYGMMSGYGGGYGYGGISGYNNYYSPFGGGMGYGQMYNPFSMY